MQCQIPFKAQVQSRKSCALINSRVITVSAQKNLAPSKLTTSAITAATTAIMVSSPTFAANELTQLAEDNRLNVLLLLLLPVLGWVLLNIGGPIQNQLKQMEENKKNLAVAGITAVTALALSEQAQAAQEIAMLGTSVAKLSSVGAFVAVAGIWIAMYLAADNRPNPKDE